MSGDSDFKITLDFSQKDEVKKFMQEFRASTRENPLNPHSRIWQDSVLFEVQDWQGKEVLLKYIQVADAPRKGVGTQAMQWLCALADKHGVRLIGDAVPKGNFAMPKTALKNFYKKFGFIFQGPTSMFREPKTKVQASLRRMVAGQSAIFFI